MRLEPTPRSSWKPGEICSRPRKPMPGPLAHRLGDDKFVLLYTDRFEVTCYTAIKNNPNFNRIYPKWSIEINRLKIKINSLVNLWDNMKPSNTYVIGNPKRR